MDIKSKPGLSKIIMYHKLTMLTYFSGEHGKSLTYKLIMFAIMLLLIILIIGINVDTDTEFYNIELAKKTYFNNSNKSTLLALNY